MLRRRLVKPEWGALTSPQPLTEEQIETRAGELLAQMSLDEKIAQMSGDLPLVGGVVEILLGGYNRAIYPAGENSRLGIPGIRFSDGPRGVVLGRSTCFPVSMARGATWDPELEERIGDAIGVEARVQGANFFAGVCINLLRHPAWGRAQETYGEDPFLLGEMGAAMLRGVQRHVMACVKHYACNSIENTRMKVNVQIGERALRDVYLPHFRRCVEAGAAAVMSAYNQVNGEACGHNRHLLREILKDEWGFQGFVVSDFVYGIRDAKAAALGGMDLEMPFRWHYARDLKGLVKSGEVPESLLDDSVRRILRQKLRFAGVGEPERYVRSAVAGPQHRALAYEAAIKSMVLLKNDKIKDGKPLLPLDPRRFPRLALIGRLGGQPNLGDHGSSRVRPPDFVAPMTALRETWKGEVYYHDGWILKDTLRLAGQCDAVVVIAGYSYKDEGENMKNRGGDRASLHLSPEDATVIRAVASVNKNVAVVLIGGSAMIIEDWRDQAAAILMAWYPGMQGGRALADLLTGRANPSGRLPCTFPKDESQLPPFDSAALTVQYGYYHGYRLLDQPLRAPAFAFGFGLSYTTFEYANLSLDRTQAAPGDTLFASVDVTNTGARAGDEVVQLYAGYVNNTIDRPLKELKGFERVHLAAGETRRVSIPLPVPSLAYYDEAAKAWKIEPGRCRVQVGPCASESELLGAAFEIGESAAVSF